MHVQNKNSNGGLFWRGYHVDTLDLPLHPVTVESEGLVQDPPLKNITMLVTGILGAGVNPISKFNIDTKNDGPWKMYLISPASKLASLWLSILNFGGGGTPYTFLTPIKNTRTVGPSRAKSCVAIATALVRRRLFQDTAEHRGARGVLLCEKLPPGKSKMKFQ